MSDSHSYICLLGDFNGRTSNDCDFISVDDIDGEKLVLEILNNNFNLNVFEQYGSSRERTNKDERKNNGNQLLHFCKYNEMLICNGRVGNDKHKGSYTCKNSSVVDYVIYSPNMFEYVEDFEILEFSNLFSDAHCPLSLTLSCRQLNSHLNSTDNACATETETNKKWDSQKKELFVNNIDENKVEEMIDRIDENASNIDVENLVKETSKILLNAASTTLGTYVYRSNAEKKSNSKLELNL